MYYSVPESIPSGDLCSNVMLGVLSKRLKIKTFGKWQNYNQMFCYKTLQSQELSEEVT